MKKHGLGIILVFMAICSQGQIDLRDYDTVMVRKPNAKKLDYEFNHPFFRSIGIKTEKAIAEGNYKGTNETATGPNSLMGIVGKGPVSNQLLPSSLVSEPGGYGWSVDVYSKGTTGNDLVKTSEGKTSEIPEDLKFYWSSGRLGLIRQGKDTVGVFGMSDNPQKDSLFRDEYLSTRSLHPPVDPTRKKEDTKMGLVYRNYGLFGTFKEAKLTVIFYERNRTAYIFLNDKLDAIFQIDYDNPGTIIIALSKKDHERVPPVLLLRKGVTEDQRADLYRLAVLSMLMAQIMR